MLRQVSALAAAWALGALLGRCQGEEAPCGDEICEEPHDPSSDLDVTLLQTELHLSKGGGHIHHAVAALPLGRGLTQEEAAPTSGTVAPRHPARARALGAEAATQPTKQDSAAQLSHQRQPVESVVDGSDSSRPAEPLRVDSSRSSRSGGPPPKVRNMEAALLELSSMLQPGAAVARHLALVEVDAGRAGVTGTFFIILGIVLVVSLLYMLFTGQFKGSTRSHQDKRQAGGGGQQRQGAAGQGLLGGRPAASPPAASSRDRVSASTPQRAACTPAPVTPFTPQTQMRGSEGYAGGGGGERAPDPPPICPALIMEKAEAKFVLSVKQLTGGTGEFEVYGSSGRKLLNGMLKTTGDNRMVALSSNSSSQDPRCRIVPGSGRDLQVYGRDNQLYGSLRGDASTGGVLCNAHDPHNGDPVMAIEIGDRSNMEMFANCLDGRRLGSASKVEQEWRLQVNPGADAVLICSSMLALLFLSESRASWFGR